MYSRVSSVQKRMHQTQIALLFPGLFIPRDAQSGRFASEPEARATKKAATWTAFYRGLRPRY
jgi:hypothetical protein